jgi:hypothetical protein
MTQLEVELTTARAQETISDSERLRHLLALIRTSRLSASHITPARLSMMTRVLGEGPVSHHIAPKADRRILDEKMQEIISAWVRLLLLGSPSGWATTCLVVPVSLGRLAQGRSRHRAKIASRVRSLPQGANHASRAGGSRRSPIVRSIVDYVYRRYISSVDISWLKAESVLHRRRDTRVRSDPPVGALHAS